MTTKSKQMNTRILILCLLAFILNSCKQKPTDAIHENKMGFIDASVSSEDTELPEMATYNDAVPGSAGVHERSFENAPPLIPHTTEGFFPITAEKNICQTCHMPDVASATGAVPISATHFMNLRPQPKLVDGKYVLPEDGELTKEKVGKLNAQYFNCNQCHVPQTKVSVDIENLFTPEFRETFGLNKSSLKDKIEEGI